MHNINKPHLLHIELERTGALALGTTAGLDLDVLLLVEGAEHVSALAAVVLDHGQLRHHRRRHRHHALHRQEPVQVALSEKGERL